MASSFEITVTVYDTDNSTLKEDVRVYARNTTKRTSTEDVFTDSSGEATIDLANLPVASGETDEYEDGDEVLIIAYYGNTHDASMYTVSGTSHSETLYLNPARHLSGYDTEKIKSLVVSNTDDTDSQNAIVYAVDDGQVLCHVQCPANDTVPVFFDGLPASGGHVIERSSEDLVCTTCLK